MSLNLSNEQNNKIVGEIWKYVCELQKGKKKRVIYYNQEKELELFDLFAKNYSKEVNYFSINDFAEFIRTNTNCSSINGFETKFEEFLKSKNYDFYFEIGNSTGFSPGYKIGQGKLEPYNKLSNEAQAHFAALDSNNILSTKSNDSWFIHYTIKASGHHKSIEKAIYAVKQSLSIYRLTYLNSSDPYFTDAVLSPLRYTGTLNGQILSIGYDLGKTLFYRNKANDKMISGLSEFINNSNRTELQKRIITVLELFGMIENATPVRMKFSLVMFALESLLLGNIDKDSSLSKKLSEKIVFLILDPTNWKFVVNDLNMNTSLMKTIVDARIIIAQKLEKIYGKRSAFVHSGANEKNITIYDFDFGLKTLHLVIDKLIELNRQGITHINKKGQDSEDKGSLDDYVERLKYR